MKILYLCPDPGIPVLGPKGAAVHVRELAAALSRAGHEVLLASPLLNKSPWEQPAAAPARVLEIRPSPESASVIAGLKQFNEQIGAKNSIAGELRRILYNKDLATELKRRLETDPPDLIYERASLYSTAGVSLARSIGRPLILELNAPLAIEQKAYRATAFGPLVAQAERWVLTHADAIVVVSDELRHHVLELGVDDGRLHVIPNGVNPSLFCPGPRDDNVRTRWNLDGRGPIIGFVGGLRPWHGVESLPDLLGRLVVAHPDARLMVVGDGPLRNDLESSLERSGLRSRAIITGFTPHETVPSLIRQFDIAVAPYPLPDHPFYFSPLKLFEYLACGVPVVAPALGQIPEILEAGQAGLLYPPGDQDALARCCGELLADPALRTRLGESAARRVRSRFTWDHNAARIANLAQTLQAVSSETRK